MITKIIAETGDFVNVIEYRDAHFTPPSLNFKFKFKLPPPRKARKIIKRDVYGRILEAITPKLKYS